jgi:hypothetical protein
MDTAELREKYRAVNEGFTQKFVFQFGRGGGFGAEMIHLLHSVVACLQNEVQFCLGEAREPRGFAVERGWGDYFEPIFPVVPGRFLGLLNRPIFPLNRLPAARFLARCCLKSLYGYHYRFLFDDIGPISARIRVPQLGLDEEYWSGIRQISNAIWVLHPQVASRLQSYRDRAALRVPYLAVHVRRGDKISEAPYTPVDAYLRVLRTLAPSSASKLPLYLATDDIRIVDEFRTALPAWEVINVAAMHSLGHHESRFNAASPEQRWEQTVFLLFELEVMKNAHWFIGASPSNIYFLTRYRRANERIIDVTLASAGP